MDARGYAKAFDGIVALACVGLAAVLIAIPAGIAGLIWAIWWAIHHIRIVP
jgi:hypothetical protein